jgi:hypothetical protein
MPKSVRVFVSALLALLTLAILYPNTIQNGEVRIDLLLYVLLAIFLPFILVVVFCRKNGAIESLGWLFQITLLAYIFAGG